jgi:DNA-binding transcriptional ArsR family regulator
MVYYRPSLDTTFAALADPTRRAILARLATGSPTISELAARFDMSLPAVSKHVRVLQRAGLTRIRRDGRSRRTTLAATPLRDALAWIERYRRFWELQFDQLATYLATSTDPSPEEATPWPARRKEQHRATSRSRSAARSPRRGSGSSARGRGRKS